MNKQVKIKKHYCLIKNRDSILQNIHVSSFDKFHNSCFVIILFIFIIIIDVNLLPAF